MKRDFCETLNLLCRHDPEFYENGAINSATVSRAVGIAQATVHRMLNGQSKEPRAVNAKKLCSYFKVTREQLVGDSPIPSFDQPHHIAEAEQVNPRLVSAYEKLRGLPREQQEAIIAAIEGLEIRRKHRP